MSSADRLEIRASKVVVYSHVFIALAFLTVAAFLKQYDGLIPLLFTIVAGINILLSFLARRIYVIFDGREIEAQDYVFKKKITIKKLTSAGVSGRGGETLYMRNDTGQHISVRLAFTNEDRAKLLARLKPLIMDSGVKRDAYVEKLINKYEAKSK